MIEYDFHAAADVAERAVALFAEVSPYVEQAGEGNEQSAKQLASKLEAIERIKSELDCLRPTFAIVYAEADKAGDGYGGPVLHDLASELIELARKANAGNSTWLARSYFANRATESKTYWCRIAADAAHILHQRSGETRFEEAIESARSKLTPNQRPLFDSMVRNRYRGTYAELRSVDGGWNVDDPSNHAILLALKEIRKRLPKADWWFEISDTQYEYNWTKRPDRK